MKKNKLAIIYARWSPRRKKDSLSALAQLDQCRNYCKFHDLEVLCEYKDEGLSGKSAINRPEFQDAMTMACKKRAVFVVYSLSRFARSTRDAIIYSEQLEKKGANLVSLKETIDTTTPMGRLFFTLMAAMAQLAREQNAEYTSDMMLTYQAQNRRMSALVPYGWHIHPDDPSMMIKDKHEQRVLERMITLRNAGCSSLAIRDILFKEGYFGRRYPLLKDGHVARFGHDPKDIIAFTIGKFQPKSILRILKRAKVK